MYCPVSICRQAINGTEGFCGMLNMLILLTHVKKKLRWSFFIKIVKCNRGGEGYLWCCRNAGNGSNNTRIYPRTPSSLNILICYPDLWLHLWVCHIRVSSDVSRPFCIPRPCCTDTLHPIVLLTKFGPAPLSLNRMKENCSFCECPYQNYFL